MRIIFVVLLVLCLGLGGCDSESSEEYHERITKKEHGESVKGFGKKVLQDCPQWVINYYLENGWKLESIQESIGYDSYVITKSAPAEKEEG